jgi:hypothetical protein
MTATPKGFAMRQPRFGWKAITLAGVMLGLIILAAANAHLVYVAFESQPDCVPHLKDAGANGSYRAAGSSC